MFTLEALLQMIKHEEKIAIHLNESGYQRALYNGTKREFMKDLKMQKVAIQGTTADWYVDSAYRNHYTNTIDITVY